MTQSHKQAKQKKQTNVNYIQADITALPFKSETFELVTSRDVIEHIPDNQLTVNEIYRVCKKDGVFTGTTSNKLNPVFFLDSFLPQEIMSILTQKYAGDHYKRHTRPTTKILHKLLQNSGFKNTHIILTGYPLFQAWDYQPDAATPKLKLPAYAYIWILFDKITKTIPLQQLKEANSVSLNKVAISIKPSKPHFPQIRLSHQNIINCIE